MKNNSTGILLILFALAPAVQGVAVAAPGADNPGLPGQVQRNSADIADNFSQIQSNRADIMDLQGRVSDLEANGGSPGGERSFVEVDCSIDGDADALLTDEGASIYFPPNTTYNIHGACNGPLFVTEDGVRFIGVEGTSPKIVLPGDASPADGAVFVSGASDVRIENLEIDASAWGSAEDQNSDAAGIYARDAFVRIRDVRVVGGLWSINPFRNALVRLDGTVVLENFVNAGLSVGDQSQVKTNGPVDISSNIVGGNYLVGIEAYRSSVVDVRGGISIDLAPGHPNRASVSSSDLSLVRVRNRGQVVLNGGEASAARLSVLRIEAGTLAGGIIAEENSSLVLRNVMQTAGDISLQMNSSANLVNVQAGKLFAYTNSSAQIFEGSLNGANLEQGATASFYGTNVFDDVFLSSATYLNFFGNGGSGSMNNKFIYKCGEFVVANITPDVAMVGGVVDCIVGP